MHLHLQSANLQLVKLLRLIYRSATVEKKLNYCFAIYSSKTKCIYLELSLNNSKFFRIKFRRLVN